MKINRKKSQLIVVAGPTASGKTDFAVELAKKVNGELVNADSRQVYKFMDIGTNKGELKKLDNGQYSETAKLPMSKIRISNLTDGKSLKDTEVYPYDIEGSGVVGWLFDIVKPDEEFTLSDYQPFAREVIKNINSRGKVAILVGGTGLYIDAVINNYKLQNVPPDRKLRQKLEQLTTERLQAKLLKLNKELYEGLNNSEQNNPRRLIRMIEKSSQRKHGQSEVVKNTKGKPLESEFIYLSLPKEELYAKINARAEQMFVDGLVGEVKKLLKMGYKNTKPLQGIGYREVMQHLDGEITLEECIEKTKQAHRNYAKRQITWFKNNKKDK